MLYIHNTTEMVAILDGGNGEEEKYGGWGLGRRKYNHTGSKQHMVLFSAIF